MALVLVLSVIALASVLGFAMLSSSALDAQVAQNSNQAKSADYLAESAVQAALFYLQYPSKLPPGWALQPGSYIHTVNQNLGEDVGGTFDLIVKETPTRNQYTIQALGRGSPASPPRVIEATARVARAKITAANHHGGSITIPVRTTITGPVLARGSITNNSGIALTSAIDTSLLASAYEVPAATKVNYYGATSPDGKYLCPDGTVGYAQKITTSLVLPAVNDNNPGRVFIWDNTLSPDLVVTSPIAINGTLVVKGGSLSIRTSGVSITPVHGYPALIVEQDLNMYRTNAALTVNGVTYVGRNLTWTQLFGANTGSSLTIKGALIMPSSSTIGTPGSGGATTIEFVEENVPVPDVSSTLQPATSVTVLSWNE